MRTAQSALLYIILLSLPVTAAAIDECGKAACEARQGKWSCAEQGIPGDGSVRDFTVRSGKANAPFLCGQAFAMRQGLDRAFVADCTLNPEQPASIENSSERRCAKPADDMSVEACVEVGGSSPSLSCRYVNPSGAAGKTVQLCGCWR